LVWICGTNESIHVAKVDDMRTTNVCTFGIDLRVGINFLTPDIHDGQTV